MKRLFFSFLIPAFLYCTVFQIADAKDSSPASSDDLDYAQVIFVRAFKQEQGVWRFEVTVRHNDEGWNHYADLWQAVAHESGSAIAERVLAHPHETEQPFTRSLGGIEIPEGTSAVTIRARCNVHGYGGREVLVDLNAKKGDGFEVNRSY
jgi:hypothetical protein